MRHPRSSLSIPILLGLLAACRQGGEAGDQPAVEAPAVTAPTAFATCAACHSVEPGGRSLVGPNLHGIVGRRAGTVAGYDYSPALRASNITWSAETLDRFIAAPTEVVPGTRMTGAIADASRRQAIIAYLAAISEPARGP